MELTVLMSVYNDSRYLESSIKSILNQSFTNFIFLIYDDASDDGSTEILKHFEKIDSRIKLVINKNNKGLSYNLAKGVEIAKTTYIARMDADDIAYKNRLMKQIEFMKLHKEVDILGSYTTDIDENGKEIGVRKVPVQHNKIASLIWTCPLIHPTVFFKRESILKVGSYNEKIRRRQDYELWFRCLKSGLKFYNLPESLLYYRSTEEYYMKNNFKVQYHQLRIGFRGSKLVRAGLMAYLGIFMNFIKGILPYRIRKPINYLSKKLDPRRKQ